MKLSILHISDLHRDPDNPIANSVLLDSLQNDSARYTSVDEPIVRAPDLIVVSGDIVQGIRHDDKDPEARLREQYQEALSFLVDLANLFVGGDRNRVVIVPGNHDVSAFHFMTSLKPVEVASDRKRDLVSQLFTPGSSLRWSWKDFGLYEIASADVYAQRLGAFAGFYREFYGTRTYDLDPKKQFDLFDYPEFGITAVAFSSCCNNDLFNRYGAIHPACIGDAGLALRTPALQERLRIAVWHHDVHGVPGRVDYMDADLLQNLIDRGFSLGFHGHQHRPECLDTRFRHGDGRRIQVISSGTLCGSASFRHGRAYNLVEIDTESFVGRVHVREMQNDNLSLPIWGRRPLPPSVAPFYEFPFDPPPEPIVSASSHTTALLEAQHQYEMKQYEKAAQLLGTIVVGEPLARPVLLDCLLKLKKCAEIVSQFDPPNNDSELIHLIDCLWAEGNRKRLAEILGTPQVAESGDPSVKEIRTKYARKLAK